MPATGEARARVWLSLVVPPAAPEAGLLLEAHGAVEVARAVRAGTELPVPGGEADDGAARRAAASQRRWHRWARRMSADATDVALRAADACQARIVVPGEPEWPEQLHTLGDRRPYLLWLRGTADLRNACLRSVSIVGARAASDYGHHMGCELGFGLAERGWSVVSGGAFGVDGAAHRGALAGGAATVAVVANGVDLDRPVGHARLFADIARRGVVVGELPPGRPPSRRGFLVRNRLIAALTPGTVVVEAGRRSGALSSARHALELNRILMAVPGAATSALSAGCHALLRDGTAVCVGDAAEVVETVGELGADLAPDGHTARAHPVALDEDAAAVLATLPAVGGAGPAHIARRTGSDTATVLRHLGLLAAAGYVRRGDDGWQRVPDAER